MKNEVGWTQLFKSLGYEWHERQRQACVLADRFRFTGYGGSRGPGKSFWLRWYLARLHLIWAGRGHTGVRTMLACEDYPSLYDRQIVKVETELPEALGRYFPTKKEFVFRDEVEIQVNGAKGKLPLGGALCLRNLDDVSKYQSSEFAAIAVDELTRHKGRRTFDILRGSLRWPGIEDTKLVWASNPTGPGLIWVRGIWIENDLPPEYEELRGQFAFIPGLPTDNPHLSDAYWIMLRTLPPVLRKAWEKGDWYSGIEGTIYPDFSGAEKGNVSEEADYREGWGPVEWWIDDGFSSEHPLYMALVQIRTNDDLCVFDEYMESFVQHDQAIEQVADRGYPLPEIARIPSEAGRLAQRLHQAYIRTAMSTHRVEEGVKVLRRMICDGQLNRRLKIHPRCRMMVQSLSTLPEDPKRNGRPLKVNGVPGDHPADAARYGVWSRRS